MRYAPRVTQISDAWASLVVTLSLSEDGWQPTSAAGLAGGKLTARFTGFQLSRYSIGEGLFVSGKVYAFITLNQPVKFTGILRVSGPTISHAAALYLNGNQLIPTGR
jgi:hypothetical protein